MKIMGYKEYKKKTMQAINNIIFCFGQHIKDLHDFLEAQEHGKCWGHLGTAKLSPLEKISGHVDNWVGEQVMKNIVTT